MRGVFEPSGPAHVVDPAGPSAASPKGTPDDIAGPSKRQTGPSTHLRAVVGHSEPLVAELLTFQLEDLGHEVLSVVKDGFEALAAVRSSEPDVLLLDTRMSGLDGLEVCRRLMLERPLPILMVAGQSDHQLIVQADSYGAAGYIVKPDSQQQLDAAITLARARFTRLETASANPAGGALAKDHSLLLGGSSKSANGLRTGQRAAETPARSSNGRPPGTGLYEADRIKVLVVDDRHLLAEALGLVIEADPDLEVAGILTDPGQVLAEARRNPPDVLLLDYVTLTRHGGAEVAASLLEEFPRLRIVVVTQSTDQDTLFSCAQAGASGYVTKDLPPAEFVRSIKRVYAGEVLFAPELLISLLMRSNRRQRHPANQSIAQTLAPRELEVLRTMAIGLGSSEAAASLGITIHTLRTHHKNVLTKLGVHSKLEAVMLALKENLIELPK